MYIWRELIDIYIFFLGYYKTLKINIIGFWGVLWEYEWGSPKFGRQSWDCVTWKEVFELVSKWYSSISLSLSCSLQLKKDLFCPNGLGYAHPCIWKLCGMGDPPSHDSSHQEDLFYFIFLPKLLHTYSLTSTTWCSFVSSPVYLFIYLFFI